MSRKRQPRIRIDPTFAGDAGAPGGPAGRLFAVACPTCHGELAVTSDMAGGEARCPICAAAFTVPEPRIAEPLVPHAVPPTALPIETPAAASPHTAAAEPAPVPVIMDAPRAAAFDPAAHAPPEPVTASADLVDAPAAESPSVLTAPADGGPAAARDSGSPPAATPRGELEFREPVRSITVGDTTVELRRLSPEEKHRRRARRNLVILVVGAAILFALVLVLGRS